MKTNKKRLVGYDPNIAKKSLNAEERGGEARTLHPNVKKENRNEFSESIMVFSALKSVYIKYGNTNGWSVSPSCAISLYFKVGCSKKSGDHLGTALWTWLTEHDFPHMRVCFAGGGNSDSSYGTGLI